MAYYTLTIFDLLRKVNPDLDVTDMDAVLAAAKEALFDNGAINLISEKYRDIFMQGFSYNYLVEEIGLETPQLFKAELMGTIINNYPYINNLYEVMGKEVFYKYSVRRSKGSTATDRNTAAQVTVGENANR